MVSQVENLSLFTLIYLCIQRGTWWTCWESFIIHLDILKLHRRVSHLGLRIFHYSPWYTYSDGDGIPDEVENLSLFTLIYLKTVIFAVLHGWESFIIHLDILNGCDPCGADVLRIFHYSPWYTYYRWRHLVCKVENLSLFTLIYLIPTVVQCAMCWESFIIHLDILKLPRDALERQLRIFHYSPWYT